MMNPPATYELALLRAVRRCEPVTTTALPLPVAGGPHARSAALARLTDAGLVTRRNLFGLFATRASWEYRLTEAGRDAVTANGREEAA